MSIQAVAWALDQDLPARPKLVLVSIANHANHIDGYCWLKAETIAAEASCSPRAVFNFVGDLIRNGYVRKALRRADDGRQRANDYWILIDRPAVPWVSTGKADHDREEECEGDEPQETEDGQPQDVVEPHAPRACGESVGPPVDKPVQTAPGAVGPHAPVCMHKDSAEPSKTNLKSGLTGGYRPRGYAPPPPPQPPPLGATTEAGMIFVFEGTRAYDAWAIVKAREHRMARWSLATSHNGRRGWWFPSLFPPQEKPPPEGTDSPLATEEDLREFAKG